jgi:hypothetical protein
MINPILKQAKAEPASPLQATEGSVSRVPGNSLGDESAKSRCGPPFRPSGVRTIRV